jgi:sugar O-acyltransferase (sialic acid O-acetyltransferase NeuD family)
MIHLIGTGGHGKVVLDALLVAGVKLNAVVARDGAKARHGQTLLGLDIVGPDICDALVGQSFHVAIGNGAVRQQLTERAVQTGAEPKTILHPAASVSALAHIGAGSFAGACAVVGPETHIGDGVIVNHGAIVDHDCRVGHFAHLAPNSTLGGGVRVGARTLIGAGAVVLPGRIIGDDVTIGAGAVVTRDVASGQIWTGVPAMPKDTE